jgi:glucan phosphorylase
LWTQVYHNPVKFLRNVKRKSLNAAIHNKRCLERYDRVMAALDAYLRNNGTWYSRTHSDKADQLIAYFSTEFGLHECFPTYAGGLGVLSGDHAKEASDLGLPFVGVGFLYNQGYFSQHITEDGWQEAGYRRYSFDDMPVRPILDAEDKPVLITVDLPGRTLHARLWKIQVGRAPLILLDSDVEQNAPSDRDLTAKVYGGDLDTRIAQEIILGIGGVRALRALNLQPSVWHMNEGHSAFMGLERIRESISQGKTFEEALADVRAATVFTTHTPVPAGTEVSRLADGPLLQQLLGPARPRPRKVHGPRPPRAAVGAGLRHVHPRHPPLAQAQRRERAARKRKPQNVAVPLPGYPGGARAHHLHHQRRAHRHVARAADAIAVRQISRPELDGRPRRSFAVAGHLRRV